MAVGSQFVHKPPNLHWVEPSPSPERMVSGASGVRFLAQGFACCSTAKTALREAHPSIKGSKRLPAPSLVLL